MSFQEYEELLKWCIHAFDYFDECALSLFDFLPYEDFIKLLELLEGEVKPHE